MRVMGSVWPVSQLVGLCRVVPCRPTTRVLWLLCLFNPPPFAVHPSVHPYTTIFHAPTMSATCETVVPEAAPRYSTLAPGPIQMWSTPAVLRF